MSSYKTTSRVSFMNAKLLLEAAAERRSFMSPQFQYVYLDQHVIDTTLSKISSSFKRIDKLLIKNWD